MNTTKLRGFTLLLLLCGLIGIGSSLVKVTAQEEFRVSEVFLKADDAKPTGKCPLLVKFNGYITANGKGTVKYTFIRSDGATSPVYTLDFKEAGTQTVSTDWTLGDAAASPRYEGWQAIKILSPNEMESSHKTGAFVIDCVGAPTKNSFLYVIREEDTSCNQIYGFSVNEATGALTPIVGFPIVTGGTGSFTRLSEQITIDRANNRLFVINAGSRTVSAYSINPTTGALTALPFSPISLGPGFYTTIAVHPTGSPLVVGDGDPSPSVRSYAITATTATEAAGSPYSTGADARPISSVFSRSGDFYYTGGNGGASFAGFSAVAGSGVLTPLAGSPFISGGGSAAGYATDTQGRLFLSNYQVDVFRVFTTASGIPSGVSGNPFTSGLSEPIDGVLHPNEQFYFVADNGANQIGSFRIGGTGAATTLTAVAGSPFSSGGLLTNSLVTNQAGTFLFATNGDSRNLTSYSVNPTNGVLANIGVQPANTLGTSGVLTGIAYYTP